MKSLMSFSLIDVINMDHQLFKSPSAYLTIKHTTLILILQTRAKF